MKKIVLLLFICSSFLFAQERVLFDSTAKADLEGFDYVGNMEITSDSGYFTQNQLTIKEPNENGIRFIATGVPKDVSTSYKILVAYPSFLNENESGAGAIQNVGDIKQIKVIATTNRPYDEIILMYSTSPKGKVCEIKMPQNFSQIRSMEEFELVFDNPLYEENVQKREIVSKPVLGSEADGLYLRGFKIKTNSPTGYSAYSPYSILYIKKVSVVADKIFTEEQIAEMNNLKEQFGIDETDKIRENEKIKIQEKKRLIENEKQLMAD